jgi:hypothetical protein
MCECHHVQGNDVTIPVSVTICVTKSLTILVTRKRHASYNDLSNVGTDAAHAPAGNDKSSDG